MKYDLAKILAAVIILGLIVWAVVVVVLSQNMFEKL
jgi:hypothetical protein